MLVSSTSHVEASPPSSLLVLESPEQLEEALHDLMQQRQCSQAMELMSRARQAGVKMTRQCYVHVLSTLREAGMVEEAKAELERMEGDGFTAEAIDYEQVMGACKLDREGDKVLQLMSEMRARGLIPTVEAYNMALHVWAARGKVRRNAKRMATDDVMFVVLAVE